MSVLNFKWPQASQFLDCYEYALIMKCSTYQGNLILGLSGSQGKALILLDSEAEVLPGVWLTGPKTNQCDFCSGPHDPIVSCREESDTREGVGTG